MQGSGRNSHNMGVHTHSMSVIISSMTDWRAFVLLMPFLQTNVSQMSRFNASNHLHDVHDAACNHKQLTGRRKDLGEIVRLGRDARWRVIEGQLIQLAVDEWNGHIAEFGLGGGTNAEVPSNIQTPIDILSKRRPVGPIPFALDKFAAIASKARITYPERRSFR